MAHFHKTCPLTLFQFTPRVLCQIKVLINLHNQGKFLEDRNVGSHFRDLIIEIILDQFQVVFHGALPEMWSNLKKHFTSDAIQGNA